MRRLASRTRERAPTVGTLAAVVLAVGLAWPARAHAADLFPVDDWLGEGLKEAGDVVLGPLKLGAKEIAQLLATIVGALADLLVPKSLVRAGVDGIEWLVQLPPVGIDATPTPGVPEVRMPHLQQLRDTLTWIGVTLMPLGLVTTGGRAFLAPTADGDSASDVLGRVIFAGVALLAYDWAWGVITELSRLLTSSLLGLPWVTDGVERMLETLVIGGATGAAVAAEFVIPLMVMVAGAVLLGLLLIRVGLEVATALLYVLGGLVLGLSVTSFGRRLLTAWLIAAAAILMLPLLWSIVFAVGAALMLDASATGGRGGFASFVAQLYNVAAALAVFWIAIKLALGVFHKASGAITGITATSGAGSGGQATRAPGRIAALAQNATPAGLARFSRNLRGNLGAAAAYPLRHPVRTAQAGSYALRRPLQATREASGALAQALSASGTRAAAAGQRAGQWYQGERHGGRFSARAADARAQAPSSNGDGTRQRASAPRASDASATERARPGARNHPPRAAADGAPAARAPGRSGAAPPPLPAGGQGPGSEEAPRTAGAQPPPVSTRPAAPSRAPAPGVARADDGLRRAAVTPPPADGRTGRPLWLWRRRAGSEGRERKDSK